MIHGLEDSIREWGKIHKERVKELIRNFNDGFEGTSTQPTQEQIKTFKDGMKEDHIIKMAENNLFLLIGCRPITYVIRCNDDTDSVCI